MFFMLRGDDFLSPPPPRNAFLVMQHWQKPKHNFPPKCDNKVILNLTWWNTSGQWVITMLSRNLFFAALRLISSTLSADLDQSKQCGVKRNRNSKKIEQFQKNVVKKPFRLIYAPLPRKKNKNRSACFKRCKRHCSYTSMDVEWMISDTILLQGHRAGSEVTTKKGSKESAIYDGNKHGDNEGCINNER